VSAARIRSAAVLVAIGLSLVPVGPVLAAADCSVTATGVAFGTYDPFAGSADDSTGTVTVTCTYTGPGGADKVNYTVSLSPGGSGSYAQRRLTVGSGLLGYNLFQDGARALVWGNGSTGTVLASGSLVVTPAGPHRTRSQSHTIYARIPQLQDAEPGEYSDSIVVTLTF
jgi:spore coat protein U-like protein